MSIPIILKALDKHLALMVPALKWAGENVVFNQPAPYQETAILPAAPDDGQIGSIVHFEQGVYQISLYYPPGAGVAEANARAQLVRLHFKRGTTLVQDGITVNIIRTPVQARGFPDRGLWKVPITVVWQAQVVVP